MSQSAVILKSNPYGLVLNLNSDLPFEELRKAVGEKFRESAGFFKNAKLALTFRGRALTKEEENQLVEEVVENSRIQVVCIVDEEKQSAEFYRRAVEKSLEKKKEEDGYFYRGTLRSSQELETETSIVVIGDVNPGARIISKGNIVVLEPGKKVIVQGVDDMIIAEEKGALLVCKKAEEQRIKQFVSEL